MIGILRTSDGLGNARFILTVQNSALCPAARRESAELCHLICQAVLTKLFPDWPTSRLQKCPQPPQLNRRFMESVSMALHAPSMLPSLSTSVLASKRSLADSAETLGRVTVLRVAFFLVARFLLTTTAFFFATAFLSEPVSETRVVMRTGYTAPGCDWLV